MFTAEISTIIWALEWMGEVRPQQVVIWRDTDDLVAKKALNQKVTGVRAALGVVV